MRVLREQHVQHGPRLFVADLCQPRRHTWSGGRDRQRRRWRLQFQQRLRDRQFALFLLWQPHMQQQPGLRVGHLC